jgi:hypothetical protein
MNISETIFYLIETMSFFVDIRGMFYTHTIFDSWDAFFLRKCSPKASRYCSISCVTRHSAYQCTANPPSLCILVRFNSRIFLTGGHQFLIGRYAGLLKNNCLAASLFLMFASRLPRWIRAERVVLSCLWTASSGVCAINVHDWDLCRNRPVPWRPQSCFLRNS